LVSSGSLAMASTASPTYGETRLLAKSRWRFSPLDGP
jgi:hypothetical protein